MRHVGSGTPLIAGNSVYVDLLFLKVSKEYPLGLVYWHTDSNVLAARIREMR
jgi:hypothetical protein